MADRNAPPQDTSANFGHPGVPLAPLPVPQPDFGYPVFFAVFPREFYNAPRAAEVLAETLLQMQLRAVLGTRRGGTTRREPPVADEAGERAAADSCDEA